MADPVWTFEDEAQLAALAERKDQFESHRRRKLERLLEDVFYSGIGFDSVAEHMIENAQAYSDALAPFITKKD